MIKNNFFTMVCLACFSLLGLEAMAQQKANEPQGPQQVLSLNAPAHISSIASRRGQLQPAIPRQEEAADKRSLGNSVVIGKDRQRSNDALAANPHPATGTRQVMPPEIVFDAYSSEISPTDPDLAIGPDHVFVVFNTGFSIYDKQGNLLLGPVDPSPAIFPENGCCDLTVSYDNAADRWVLSFLGTGAQIAVSDGPDPINDGWYVYSIGSIDDYQKLSIWSDGYYMTDNTNSANKVWVLQRDELLVGNPGAGVMSFDLPGIETNGFYSPQPFHVTNGDMPATGGATIVYMQDDAFTGIDEDHLKLWTIDVDWTSPASSTISAAVEIPTTPFISVFDGGGFANLTQPDGGQDIDALQATIMQQAHFRRFPTHNSVVFNFVVDTDAGAGELAGIRWYEMRQSADNEPWTVYQEGTFVSPDGKHAWMGDMAMDANGNIAMGYTAMAGPTTTNPTDYRVSAFYTGRYDGDPLGTMTVMESVIAMGNDNIPNLRYGDYSKIDVDPSNDEDFWFIDEYMSDGRTGVVGMFTMEPNTLVDDMGVTTILTPTNGELNTGEIVQVLLRNFGTNDITDPVVQYQIDGGTPVAEIYNGTIPAGSIASYTFSTTADLSGADTYVIRASSAFAGDTNPNNDWVEKLVTEAAVYCTPYVDCTGGDGFRVFQLAEIDHESDCEGYADFSHLVAMLDAGSSYDLTITTHYGDQYLNVWVDWDDNGNFAPEELLVHNYIIAEDQAGGVYTETIQLDIPVDAPNGQHRLRAKTAWNGDVPLDACEVTNYGETEDYTVQIGVLGTTVPDLTDSEMLVIDQGNDQYEVKLLTNYDGRMSIGVYNVLGQTLAFNNLKREADGYSYSLNMSYAAAGVYLIKMGDPSGKAVLTSRLIVK